MSRRMKLLIAALGLIVILIGVFASIALAADPNDNQELPACCQQKPGSSAVSSCCGQQGITATNLYQNGSQGSCCGR